jgi:hypothetical protein
MPSNHRTATHIFLLLFALCTSACADGRSAGTAAAAPESGGVRDSSFAQLIERLSEPGGYFDTDNLISNETSYLHVMGGLRNMDVSGGAYIGVGPDQNFSYIAGIRPSIAFIIDIRRDNLLQHFLFKSLFTLAENRIEYLCLLLGRPFPEDPGDWNRRSVARLVEYLEATPAELDFAEVARATVAATAGGFGYPLSDEDIETIRRFHGAFIEEGLDLQFESHGRRPRGYYPTFRQLLLETDLSGRQENYLAGERDFRFVKSMQERDLVIPVIGDFAGDHALAAIAALIDERGEEVSAFYTSNVEYYLVQDRSFHKFIANLRRLPHDEESVIIRSYFGRNFGYLHPQAVPGYYSVQLLQPIENLISGYDEGRFRTYLGLVTDGAYEFR